MLIMVLGPIAVRIAYELVLMAVLLVKNVVQINNKLKAADNGQENQQEIFAAPQTFTAPAEETAAPRFCRSCGAQMKAGKFCPSCGFEN